MSASTGPSVPPPGTDPDADAEALAKILDEILSEHQNIKTSWEEITNGSIKEITDLLDKINTDYGLDFTGRGVDELNLRLDDMINYVKEIKVFIDLIKASVDDIRVYAAEVANRPYALVMYISSKRIKDEQVEKIRVCVEEIKPHVEAIRAPVEAISLIVEEMKGFVVDDDDCVPPPEEITAYEEKIDGYVEVVSEHVWKMCDSYCEITDVDEEIESLVWEMQVTVEDGKKTEGSEDDNDGVDLFRTGLKRKEFHTKTSTRSNLEFEGAGFVGKNDGRREDDAERGEEKTHFAIG
ncbi:hypothetical protein ABFX02_11G105500 [Erythranthe guttata]